MSLITQASDPVLFAQLHAMYIAQRQPGWVVVGEKHYRHVQESDGDEAYQLVDNRSLYDSRSLTLSKPAVYTELDQEI